ncbi:dienelactone hydrolase [Suillus paluster]|uniref:dienelactone hydrolase n=1 Tax=Suillus paluster TaxID=48578 RepID=UPI001B85EAFE|nr:dienelactone hydrolase [Suillus paluster]KAG1742676.1 dienelactone hydrolase [Suillus paluster]
MASQHSEHCFTAAAQSGTPVGRQEEIASVQTYVSEPKNPSESKAVILYFSDVFGPFIIHNQLTMDYYASHGFTVLGLDYFFGEPMQDCMNKPDFDRAAWMEKAYSNAKTHTRPWVDAVVKKYGSDKKYCAVGFCFGGPPVFNLAKEDGLIVCGAIAHPAAPSEELTEIDECTVPILFSCAETDRTFPRETRRKVEDRLVEQKKTYYFQIFSGVNHGFAVRCDPNVENERWAKEECQRGMVAWFKRFTA